MNLYRIKLFGTTDPSQPVEPTLHRVFIIVKSTLKRETEVRDTGYRNQLQRTAIEVAMIETVRYRHKLHTESAKHRSVSFGLLNRNGVIVDNIRYHCNDRALAAECTSYTAYSGEPYDWIYRLILVHWIVDYYGMPHMNSCLQVLCVL